MESCLACDLCVVGHMPNASLSMLLQRGTTACGLLNAAEGQQVKGVTLPLSLAPVRLARQLGG